MRINAVKDGWQRFLDRLRRLWGKPRQEELPTMLVESPEARAGR